LERIDYEKGSNGFGACTNSGCMFSANNRAGKHNGCTRTNFTKVIVVS